MKKVKLKLVPCPWQEIGIHSFYASAPRPLSFLAAQGMMKKIWGSGSRMGAEQNDRRPEGKEGEIAKTCTHSKRILAQKTHTVCFLMALFLYTCYQVAAHLIGPSTKPCDHFIPFLCHISLFPKLAVFLFVCLF